MSKPLLKSSLRLWISAALPLTRKIPVTSSATMYEHGGGGDDEAGFNARNTEYTHSHTGQAKNSTSSYHQAYLGELIFAIWIIMLYFWYWRSNQSGGGGVLRITKYPFQTRHGNALPYQATLFRAIPSLSLSNHTNLFSLAGSWWGTRWEEEHHRFGRTRQGQSRGFRQTEVLGMWGGGGKTLGMAICLPKENARHIIQWYCMGKQSNLPLGLNSFKQTPSWIPFDQDGKLSITSKKHTTIFF